MTTRSVRRRSASSVTAVGSHGSSWWLSAISAVPVARGAVEGGDGRGAVQGAGERMLAATRSKDEYSHVTRAYRSPRGNDGGDPARYGVVPSEATVTAGRVNLTVMGSVLNVGW